MRFFLYSSFLQTDKNSIIIKNRHDDFKPRTVIVCTAKHEFGLRLRRLAEGTGKHLRLSMFRGKVLASHDDQTFRYSNLKVASGTRGVSFAKKSPS